MSTSRHGPSRRRSPDHGAALVTGCSSGIGRASALALHAAGFDVYATARRPAQLAELAERGIRTLPLDVTSDASMSDAVDRVQADHGAVTVLVNNAGYGLQGPVETTPMDQVRQQFETNVFGLVRMCQLVLPAMRAQGHGRVVNMSSMGGRFTFPGGGFYHATKHAVEAISDALRYELTPFGVRVVLVEPGPVLSSFGDTAVSTMAAPAGGPEEEQDDGYAGFRLALAQRYAEAYDGRPTRLASSPDRVARVVVRAALARHPRARYVVGPVAHGLVGLRRFAPGQVFDAAIRATFPVPHVRRSTHTSR